MTVNEKAVWIRRFTHRVAHRTYTMSASVPMNFTISGSTLPESFSTTGSTGSTSTGVTYAHAHYPVWEEVQQESLLGLSAKAWIQRLYLRLPDAA